MASRKLDRFKALFGSQPITVFTGEGLHPPAPASAGSTATFMTFDSHSQVVTVVDDVAGKTPRAGPLMLQATGSSSFEALSGFSLLANLLQSSLGLNTKASSDSEVVDILAVNMAGMADALAVLSVDSFFSLQNSIVMRVMRHVCKFGGRLLKSCRLLCNIESACASLGLRSASCHIVSLVAQEKMTRATELLDFWLNEYSTLYQKYRDLQAPILSAAFVMEDEDQFPKIFAEQLRQCRLWLGCALLDILASSVLYMRPASAQEQHLFNSSNVYMSKKITEEVSRPTVSSSPPKPPLSAAAVASPAGGTRKISRSAGVENSKESREAESLEMKIRAQAVMITSASTRLIEIVNHLATDISNVLEDGEEIIDQLSKATSDLWTAVRDVVMPYAVDQIVQDVDDLLVRKPGEPSYLAVSRAISYIFEGPDVHVLQKYSIKAQQATTMSKHGFERVKLDLQCAASQKIPRTPAGDEECFSNETALDALAKMTRLVDSEDDSGGEELDDDTSQDVEDADPVIVSPVSIEEPKHQITVTVQIPPQKNVTGQRSSGLDGKKQTAITRQQTQILQRYMTNLQGFAARPNSPLSQSLDASYNITISDQPTSQRKSAFLLSDINLSKPELRKSARNSARLTPTSPTIPEVDEQDGLPYWDESESDIYAFYYEDENNLNQPRKIVAASLNKLIGRLTNENVRFYEFRRIFLTTFTSFVSPQGLLLKLQERFTVPDPPASLYIDPEEWRVTNRLPIQTQVLEVIKDWVATRSFEITEKLLPVLLSFLDLAEKADAQHKQDVDQIKATIRERTFRMSSRVGLHVQPKIADLLQKPTEAPPVAYDQIISKYSIEELGDQITLMIHKIYSRLETYEFLQNCWSNANLTYRCPNLFAMIHKFNCISSWVAYSISSTPKLKDRIATYSKFVKLAEHLRHRSNFDAMFAVTSGILSSAIHRLKYTRAGISDSTQKMLQHLSSVISPYASYKDYRRAIDAVNPPAVPYIGVYLTDLTFIEHGNPDFFNKLINFHKRELIFK
eukprot:TRINITY_DN5229_c0_g1_i1.p1 TRINITY_DN5229_c0_g1~~TRINITY_DN5229_c0_g1_i1.p1  ORF type:complete len:1023 (+),score=199.17 TRINITY_DN5229_c0_g1_i1:71-3139(+)